MFLWEVFAFVRTWTWSQIFWYSQISLKVFKEVTWALLQPFAWPFRPPQMLAELLRLVTEAAAQKDDKSEEELIGGDVLKRLFDRLPWPVAFANHSTTQFSFAGKGDKR